MNRAHFIVEDENAKPVSSSPWKGRGKGKWTMKRIALIAAVGFLLALSAHCAADSATQPTSQPSKAKTFLLVEVKGTIGKDFTAAKLKAAISEARTAKVAAIVLSMDTPGGAVAEAEAIVDLIIENKDLRFIALVNRALSAGATITLACKEIYVMETATIGAAVSYVSDKRGLPANLPADVAEKFQSAWRAVCRKAADHGGHSSLLAEGMADPSFAITKRTENGKVILERDGKGEVVKASGRILTLTAKEAVACGLAKAVVPDVADLGAKLGMPKWREPGSDSPTPMLPESEIRTLFSQYRLLRQMATVTDAAVRAKEEEITKKLVGRNVELAGTLIDVRPEKEGFVVSVQNESGKAPFVYNYWRESAGVVYSGPVETINIDMMSADNRWVSAKKGSRVVVMGRIRKIRLIGGKLRHSPSSPDAPSGVQDRPDVFFLDVAIAMEELGPQDVSRQRQPAREPKSTSTAPVDPEAEAKKRLNLADTYMRNKMTAPALKMLRSIVEDFPNTAAAKEAKEQIKQLLEDEAQKAGKGS